ncbi:MAG: class I SAM-dependent methyltransferase [Acidimicrobiia bacterium]
MSWSDLADWWLGEIGGDPAYEIIVTPLLLRILDPVQGARYIDLGSGEGRIMKAVASRGASVQGVELNETLARKSYGQSIVAQLPRIPIRDDSYDGGYAVLVIEHLSDHEAFFSEIARVVRSGGALAVVANHPVWTAPESSPVTDTDGEVLWRPGKYFSADSTEVTAGEGLVTFYHRSMGALLNAAADAGWSLDHMIEQPHHEFDDPVGIPRLLACRWRLLP